VQYKIRRPVVLADGPDARHTRAWVGGPSHAIPSDPSSGPSARRVLVRPVYSFKSTSHTIYLSVFLLQMYMFWGPLQKAWSV